MRPSTPYKIVGGTLLGFAGLSIVAALSGDPRPGGPGVIGILLGFLAYRRGMRLAYEERGGPPQPSIHAAMFTAWSRQLKRRLLGRE